MRRVIKGKFKQPERISRLESRVIELVYYEEQKEERRKKMHRPRDTAKWTNSHIVESRKRVKGTEGIYEERMTRNAPSLMNDMNINIFCESEHFRKF